MRPVLSPAVRRLWRDQQTLQLGRPPGRSLLLSGLDGATRAVLALLDGTRDRAGVLAAAPAVGCPADRAEALLDLLAEGGLLLDAAQGWPVESHDLAERDRLAPDAASLSLLHGPAARQVLRGRTAARVVVVGAGRVGAALAALLASAGVGQIDVVDDGRMSPADAAAGGLRLQDVGRLRDEATRERLRQAAPATSTDPQPSPDLVVLAPVARLDDDQVAALTRDVVPHLLAEVRDTVGVVGPLVAGHGPCLRCLDHVRTELDAAWPVLAAQLSSATRRSAPCDGPLAAAVAAHAALQVLSWLDGTGSACVGGTLELALPDWRWRRRSWPAHPACDCRWRVVG